MIQSLDLLITTLIAATTAIVLMFLPAIIELKKPRDAGPRLITDYFAQMGLSALRIPLINIEDGGKLDSQLTVKIASFLYFIPNLEA
jgi:hypothetical protein